MFDSWWESWLMWKSIDDKVEKALRTHERTHERTDIADSRVASRLKTKSYNTYDVWKQNMIFQKFSVSRLWA